MELKVFYISTFISLATSSAKIYCDFEKLASYYSCNPIKIEGSISDGDSIIVHGTHLSNFKDDDVNYLRFNSPLTFDHVPTKIFETFINLEIFGLHSVNLTSILRNSFVSCYKLKSLHVDNNKNLEVIHESFAEDCSSLKNIYMSGNGLKFIDENTFHGLYNLNYLTLSKNQIENLPPTIFKQTPNLEFLFLDFNKIESLNSELLFPLRKLQTLSITHNLIKSIALETLRNNQLLDQIFFDSNHINSIDPKFFDEFPGKRDFYEYRFYNNNCTNAAMISSKLPDENEDFREEKFKICIDLWYESNPDSTTDITKLFDPIYNEDAASAYEKDCRYFLNENRKYTCVLENVNLVLDSIYGEHIMDYNDENVTQVFFFNSTLSNVPQEVFRKFRNLEFLSVTSTHLSIIDENTFGACGNVQKIDASGNKISKIEETAFKNCKNLEVLDVSGNPIDAIESEIFFFDRHLKQIILRKNY